LDGEKSAPPSDADWSAFISDIKALSELLILLVAAMRYLSCPAVGHPISPPMAPPFFFRVVNARCRWPRSCMRQLYGPCVVCDASLAPDPMAKSGNSLKEGQNRNGVDKGGVSRTSDRLPETQGLGHSWCRSSPLIDSDPIDRQHHATAHSLQLHLGLEIEQQRRFQRGFMGFK